VVEAINAASSLTGVVAIDTGYDNQGIRLEAVDGRNIEVSFNTAETASVFASRTGLKEGIQSGSYSLESSVEGNIILTTSTTGDITRSGFTHNLVFDASVSPDYVKGDYSDNISRYVTGTRSLVTDPSDVKPLTISDLVLNGVAIRASLDGDDKVSLESGTSDRSSSAIAIAAAINAHYSSTGVRSVAAEAVTTGTDTTAALSGSKTLYGNGVGISIDFSTSVGDKAQRRNDILNAINAQTPNTGVYARDTGSGGITLATRDGRNLSVWFNDSQGGDNVTAAEFGLLGESGVVGGTALTASSAPTKTIYCSVTLMSSKKFTVEPGFDGFNADSNFTALGFKQGTYGGEVSSSEGKMTPPRTGRLAFQVGASAGQLITIDLADFGKGGPITSAITGDVNNLGTVTAIGNRTTTTMLSGQQSLFINGVEVIVNFNNQGPEESASQAAFVRRDILVRAINALKTEHNVKATDNGTGITLTNLNGSNISVWYDSDKVSAASEFGLGGADGVTGTPGAIASFQGAKILYPETNNIRSAEHATNVLSKLDKVMDRVNANRANMGAVMNRLQYAIDNLSNVSMNSSASRSQIEDADYAAASTELAKTQIMQQAATSVLAQANMSQQTVLKLLGG
jgi:flagellin